jgi:anti-sigma factor RsiW
MKDSEFIELLNLYVDHEIGAGDAKRLEAEVTADPARRQIYRQYCSIQKACKVLADRHLEPVPEAPALPVRRESPRWAAIVPASGLALAACIAVVLVVRSQFFAPAPAGRAASVVAAHEGSATQAGLPSIAPDNYARALVPALSVRAFSLNTDAHASEGLMAAASQNQDTPLAWIARLQMQSNQQIPADQVNFKPSTAFLTTDVQDNRSSSEEQEPEETVAFRFQR